MTQGNSRGATGVMPGTAEASAYAPLRQPVFRALWLASRRSRHGYSLLSWGALTDSRTRMASIRVP